MKRYQWLAITASLAALAACKADVDTNTANADLNATVDNTALAPVDMNADLNADMNMTNDMNVVDNTANNTANSY
jgi:hypothetical protein